MSTLWGIFLIVVIAGPLGGGAAYVLEQMRDKSIKDGRRLLQNMFLGVIGAALVPAALVILTSATGATSGLVDQLTGTNATSKHWLVFFGFCLAAGVTSKGFVSSVSEKLVREAIANAKEAKQEAQDASSDVEGLESDVAESKPKQESVSPLADRVLKAMKSTGYRRPGVEAIATTGNIKLEEVKVALDELTGAGFVQLRKDHQTGDPRWRIRAWGKDYLNRSHDDPNST